MCTARVQVVSAELNVDRVDRLRDELDQQHEDMRQIADLLGQPIGAAADFDLDDIEAELEVGAHPSQSPFCTGLFDAPIVARALGPIYCRKPGPKG